MSDLVIPASLFVSFLLCTYLFFSVNMLLYALFTLVALFLAKVLLFPKRIAKKKAHRSPTNHYSAYTSRGEYFACDPDGELDLPQSGTEH
jgi:hypothetical protein